MIVKNLSTNCLCNKRGNYFDRWVICYFDRKSKWFNSKSNPQLDLTHGKVYEVFSVSHKSKNILLKVKNDSGRTLWYDSGRFITTKGHEKELNVFLRKEKLKKIENGQEEI